MGDTGTYLLLLVVMVGFLVVPQLLNRRRQKKREEELRVGDKVMTIGGLLGELTYINFPENLARIRLAEGVEVELIPGAIGGKHKESVDVDAGSDVDEVSGSES